MILYVTLDDHDKAFVTFWITKEELTKFDSIAKEKQISRAALLRGFIIESNKSYEKLNETRAKEENTSKEATV